MSLASTFPILPTLLLMMSGALCAEDDLTLDQLPAPVATTLRAQANGAAIEEIESQQEKGTTIYEAEIRRPSGKVTITISATGVVLGSEANMAVTAMPHLVQKAITATFGAKAPTTGEMETTADVTEYSVEGRIGPDEVEVRFAADGTERSREVDQEDHDDEDQDGDGQKDQKNKDDDHRP